MEMPVPCDNCGEWVELNDCKESDLTKKLMCRSCCQVEDEVHQLKEEITDLHLDLDNEAEYTVGNRRMYKKEIKEKKERIKELGFSYDDLVY